MRKKGLEPPRLAAPDPKSGAATNYATSAVRILLSHKDRNETNISQDFFCLFLLVEHNYLFVNLVILIFIFFYAFSSFYDAFKYESQFFFCIKM